MIVAFSQHLVNVFSVTMCRRGLVVRLEMLFFFVFVFGFALSIGGCGGIDDCASSGLSASAPKLSCRPPDVPRVCGDSVLVSPEDCDDGNLLDGDGCESDCTFTPICGNDRLEQTEECDDGNLADGDGCQSDCTLVVVPAEITCTVPIAQRASGNVVLDELGNAVVARVASSEIGSDEPCVFGLQCVNPTPGRDPVVVLPLEVTFGKLIDVGEDGRSVEIGATFLLTEAVNLFADRELEVEISGGEVRYERQVDTELSETFANVVDRSTQVPFEDLPPGRLRAEPIAVRLDVGATRVAFVPLAVRLSLEEPARITLECFAFGAPLVELVVVDQ